MLNLDFTSIWPYFVIMLVFVLFAAWLVNRLPFYKQVIDKEERGRYETLDGLRGFLALNVFFQHAVTSYFYFQTGLWQIVDVRFYRHLGGEAVILFFMITSFLYWSKAIAQKGDLDAGDLFRSRFLRLAPMYLFASSIIIFSILVQSGLNIHPIQTIKDILSFFTLGLITTTSVNNISVLPVNAGIHWTLHFEWFFYLLLPVMAVALKSREMKLTVLPIAFFALVSPDRGYWVIFLFGIMAAHIFNRYPVVHFFKRSIASILPILGIVLVYFIQYKPYSLTQYLVTMLVFLAFVYGADIWGLLKTRAAKFLGTISYSIYLIHSIVMFAILNSVDHFYPVASLGPWPFWGLMVLIGLVTICISSITYYYIEYPFIQMIRPRRQESLKTNITEQVM